MYLHFTSADTINLAIALATCAAAWASVKAARAAKRQGDAAWEQAELLRPRPVLAVEGNWDLEGEAVGADGFVIRNLGSSPAFDITISDIEGPLLRSVGYSERLVTERVFALAEHGEARAVHHRITPGSQLSIKAASAFVRNSAGALSPRDEAGNFYEPVLAFVLSYSGADSERFVTPCVIRFSLGLPATARVAPAATWLPQDVSPAKP
jgi:hypothetical protein